MSKTKKKTTLKLTQAIMAESLLYVRDDLRASLDFCEWLLKDALAHNDYNSACGNALRIDIYKAMLELLTSGNLIVNINGTEYPLIYLYNVIPAGKENNVEA